MNDPLTTKLYQENINWIYSIIRELDAKGIESKDKFIANPYNFNSMVVLGYYFMNLYVTSNIHNYTSNQTESIMNAIITGASTYNQTKLSAIYKKDIDLNRIVEQYNGIVRKTKLYAPNDGLKARVVAVDDAYRKIYDTFNKKHFNVFIRVFMSTFTDFENRIKRTINEYVR